MTTVNVINLAARGLIGGWAVAVCRDGKTLSSTSFIHSREAAISIARDEARQWGVDDVAIDTVQEATNEPA